MNIVLFEKPIGVIASLGGQTAINLAEPIMKRGVKIIGTSVEAIDRAENRDSFEKVLQDLDIPQPDGRAVTKSKTASRQQKKSAIRFWSVLPSYLAAGRCRSLRMKNSCVTT